MPHAWTDKVARKVQATKELWGTIFGVIDTPEEFEAHRLALATREWSRLKANNSLECRNCHSSESMDIGLQSARAAAAISPFLGSLRQ